MPNSSNGAALDQQVETEIKFSVSPENLELIKKSPIFPSALIWRRHLLKTVYFDTDEHDLKKNGLTLRVRHHDDATYVMTLKTVSDGGLPPLHRVEVEVALSSERPELTLFASREKHKLQKLIDKRGLTDQFEIDTIRQTANIEHAGSTIEVAIDTSRILASGNEADLNEVEIELKQGQAIGLCDFAHKLAAELPLSIKFSSKAQAGYEFLTKSLAQPCKFPLRKLHKKTPAEEALSVILEDALMQVICNWDAAPSLEQPEILHHLRVGLRRIRSLLEVMIHDQREHGLDELNEQIGKTLAGLNLARDCDIASGIANSKAFRAGLRPECRNALLLYLENKKHEAYSRAHVELRGTGSTLLILKLFLQLFRRIKKVGHQSDREKEEGVNRLARKSLTRLHALMCERAQKISDPSPSNLHKLRVAVKGLRYAVECFSGALPKKKLQRSYLDALRALQDILGSSNDGVVMDAIVLEIPSSAAPELHEAAGFVLGWNAAQSEVRALELKTLVNHLERTKSFWK